MGTGTSLWSGTASREACIFIHGTAKEIEGPFDAGDSGVFTCYESQGITMPELLKWSTDLYEHERWRKLSEHNLF